jgi:polyisoprenoid-binding protein YceI
MLNSLIDLSKTTTAAASAQTAKVEPCEQNITTPRSCSKTWMYDFSQFRFNYNQYPQVSISSSSLRRRSTFDLSITKQHSSKKSFIMKTRNNNRQLFRFLLLAVTAFFTLQLNAQSVKKTFSYEITLLGTSNIHDWKMTSSGSNLEANFNLNPTTKLVEGIQPLTFNMPVKTLKSGEGLLNSRAYDALKADKFPNITFKLISATPNGNQMDLVGQLTISGNTRDITLVANRTKNADGSQVLSGTQKIKMTEWGVKPPSYMLGMMKVHDDLTINYTVRF